MAGIESQVPLFNGTLRTGNNINATSVGFAECDERFRMFLSAWSLKFAVRYPVPTTRKK
jgi:hypothetical protein